VGYLDDVRLDKPVEDSQSSGAGGPGRRILVIVLALLVVGAAAGIYLVFGRREAEAPVRTTTEQPVKDTATGPTPEAGENIPLPPLDVTDPVVRKLVGQLSAHPRVAAWLATDDLVRNFSVVTLNVAEGKTPVRHLRAQAPPAKFRARATSTGPYLDPQNYQRYDAYADAVGELDARGTARLYRTLRPRIVEAYAEQGIAEDKVDGVLERAIAHLLATPVVDSDVALKQKTVSYAMADERLESLSPAQKQLFRMGPRNVKIIQAKLRDIALYLGISQNKLPPT
jgi:Protein of unknown function (DUF3014)